MKTGVGVLIFGVNRSRIGVGFYNFVAGLESESQKSDSGHLCTAVTFLRSCVAQVHSRMDDNTSSIMMIRY